MPVAKYLPSLSRPPQNQYGVIHPQNQEGKLTASVDGFAKGKSMRRILQEFIGCYAEAKLCWMLNLLMACILVTKPIFWLWSAFNPEELAIGSTLL